VAAALPDALRLDLLHEGTFRELLGNAHRLEAIVDGSGARACILDEVQKLPALLDEVHRLIEGRGLRFALTGSSARKLRRSGVNLLAGRAHSLAMHPFTPSELGEAFDVARAARHGLLPAAWTSPEPASFLSSYVGTYLREEVLQEALVRNLATFHRFLEAASFSQGQPLNLQAVASDCGLPRRTVASHFDLLEDLLLAVRLPVFHRRAARRLTTHPKFFYFDAGVYRALRPRGPLDSAEEIDGAALETLALQTLRAEDANRDLGYQLAFWRTPEGREVDLVAYGERGLHAIEVKRSDRLREADLEGLRLFCTDYPESRGLLLYGGATRYQFGAIDVVPMREGLLDLGDRLAGTGR
jgi:predicted AAA+ superfamily ATPase